MLWVGSSGCYIWGSDVQLRVRGAHGPVTATDPSQPLAVGDWGGGHPCCDVKAGRRRTLTFNAELMWKIVRTQTSWLPCKFWGWLKNSFLCAGKANQVCLLPVYFSISHSGLAFGPFSSHPSLERLLGHVGSREMAVEVSERLKELFLTCTSWEYFMAQQEGRRCGIWCSQFSLHSHSSCSKSLSSFPSTA